MRSDATRNQQSIIDAARHVLAEHGVDARMDTIAARAGVGIGTVYRHFPNKEALIEELVRLNHEELTSAAVTALARGDGTGLEAFLHTLGQSFTDHHGYADQLMKHVRSTDSPSRIRALLGRLLDQAQGYAQVNPALTLGDILTAVWALRGIVEATAGIAPGAWKRHLDIMFVGLRADLPAGIRPALTQRELTLIADRKVCQPLEHPPADA